MAFFSQFDIKLKRNSSKLKHFLLSKLSGKNESSLDARKGFQVMNKGPSVKYVTTPNMGLFDPPSLPPMYAK